MATSASQLERRHPSQTPPTSHVTTGPTDVDVSGLKRALQQAVSGEVRFDAGTRAMYANDFSIYRAVPIGVVIPRGPDDVIAAVAICREYQAPVLPRGCGTAPSGQTTNVAVVFDYSKYYNQIVELDPDGRRARVQPGVICDQLRNAAEEFNLTYGPDPATHEYCTFGGMLGNNSCGTHSLMAGKTSDNVIELDVVLYDGTRLTVGATSDEELERIIAAGGRKGEIYDQLKALRDRVADRVRAEFPDIPRRVSGYNLDQLLPENGFNVARALVGSEGTCANVLHATVRLVPSPQHRRTVLLGYPDVFLAADHVPVILERCKPIGLEGFDDQLIKNMIAKSRLAAERTLLPDGRAWLYVEFGHDDPDAAMAETRQALEDLADGPQIDARVIVDKLDQVSVWKVRESAVGDSRAPGYMDAEGNWEDAAVHPDKLGAYLRDFQQILDDHGYRCVYYGHFGQGCVHTRMDFDLKTAAGVKTFRSFMEKCADLVVAYGGSLAGEYGEGHGRAELLPKMFGPELMEAFNDFKRIWDPDWKMNPNRLIGDVKLDEGLRLGPDYRPPAADHPLRLPRRRRLVRDRDRALLRDGQVPQPRQPDDVPELPRHPRGTPLHPRPLPAAVRDAQGRPGLRRLARRRGQGIARPVPVLQGVHGRLPGPGRHPHLQGRVPGPLLRKAPAAAAPLRAGPDALVGPAGGARAPAGQRAQPFRAGRPTCQADARHGRAARDPEVRAPDVPQLVREPKRRAPHAHGRTPGRAVARHVHRPVRAAHRQGCGRGARGRRLRGRDPAEAPLLRAAAVRLRDARASPSARSRTSSTACPSRSSPACRWSCSSRAARRCSATSCAS